MTSSQADPLERLLADIRHEVYPSLILKLAQQFQSELTQAEARIYDEAVLRLARSERTEVRTRLSCLLAPVEAGPACSVSDLAYDLDPVVAAPVLRQSVLLQEEDLITIARTRSQGHLMALAERLALSAAVTDVVVARGSWPVLRLLAANSTAELSRHALARLAALSRGDGHITVALRKRRDVPAGMKHALLVQFQKMALARRTSLCGEHSKMRLSSEAAVGSNLKAQLVPVGRRNADPLSTETLRGGAFGIDALSETQPLTSAEASRRLTQGATADALVMVARLVDQEPEPFIQALRSMGAVRNLALLRMRNAGLSWSMIERLLHAVVGKRNSADEFTWLNITRPSEEAYTGLSRQVAQGALRAVEMRSEFRIVGDEKRES